LVLKRHDNGVLLAAGILMLVANYDPMPLGERSHNHRMAPQERGDTEREFSISILALANPGRHISRKPEPGMISGRDMRNHAVDGADFDAGANALCALGEDGTGSVRMRQDEEP
jgi:hypothetical protein